MKPLHFSVLIAVLAVCATVLVALGKVPANDFLPIVTALLGWLLPSPVAKAKVGTTAVLLVAALSTGCQSCVAHVEAAEAAELAACGEDASGDCSTDAIGEKYDQKVRECYR